MKIDMVIGSNDFSPNTDFDEIARFLTESMKDRFHLMDNQVGIKIAKGISQLNGDFQGKNEEVKDFFDEIVDIAKKQLG